MHPPLLVGLAALVLGTQPCHGLRPVASNRTGHFSNVTFATHHKTGTALLRKAEPCFNKSHVKINRVLRWKGGVIDDGHVIHIVRNPVSMVVSAYLYHRDVGETWTKAPGSAMAEMEGKNRSWIADKIQEGESYSGFLKRVDPKYGLHIEFLRTQKSIEAEMIPAMVSCKKQPAKCKQFCLEDFTQSSSAFDESWNEIWEFLRRPLTPVARECLTMQDLHRRTVHDPHLVTMGQAPIVQGDELETLTKEANDIDRRFFKHYMKKVARHLSCKPDSKVGVSLRRQAIGTRSVSSSLALTEEYA